MSQQAMTITRNFIISMDPPDCKRFWIPTNLLQFSNRVEFSPPTQPPQDFCSKVPGRLVGSRLNMELMRSCWWRRSFENFVESQTAIPQKGMENGRSEKLVLQSRLNRPKLKNMRKWKLGILSATNRGEIFKTVT